MVGSEAAGGGTAAMKAGGETATSFDGVGLHLSSPPSFPTHVPPHHRNVVRTPCIKPGSPDCFRIMN